MMWTDAVCMQILRDADDGRYINVDMMDPPEVIGRCAYCGHELTTEDNHYDIDGKLVCFDPFGDCLLDYMDELHGHEFAGDSRIEFERNGKPYRILRNGDAGPMLMQIFDDCYVAGQQEGF